MSTQTAALPATHFRRGWIYALTLALVTINYMDRSALASWRKRSAPNSSCRRSRWAICSRRSSGAT